MKNKKLLGITAALAVTVLTGGSLAIFAAETVIPGAEIVEAEPVVEETEAASAVSEAEADDADYSYHVGQQSSIARNDAYEALPEGGTRKRRKNSMKPMKLVEAPGRTVRTMNP